jgi:hypothetical protein
MKMTVTLDVLRNRHPSDHSQDLYEVVTTTNRREPRVGDTLDRKQVDRLLDEAAGGDLTVNFRRPR